MISRIGELALLSLSSSIWSNTRIVVGRLLRLKTNAESIGFSDWRICEYANDDIFRANGLVCRSVC